MAITTKKKPGEAAATSEDHERLITTALEQADTISASIRTELQQIAFSGTTITTLQSEIAQRQRDCEAVQRQLQAIQQTVTDARIQVSHSTGAAAQSVMTTLLAAEQDAQNAQQQLDTMLREHTAADQAAEASITEQQQAIVVREKHIHELENELRTIGEVRQKHLASLGESLHRQATQRLAHLTTRAQASEDQHVAAKHDLAIARREEDQKLARWPELRANIRCTYAIGEDATSTALALLIHFLDTVTRDHQAIEYAGAGLPSGVYSILNELAIDPYQLRALAATGDASALLRQKERLEGIHKSYCANLAVANKQQA